MMRGSRPAVKEDVFEEDVFEGAFEWETGQRQRAQDGLAWAEAPDRGLSVQQAAVKLGVSAATAHRWLPEQ